MTCHVARRIDGFEWRLQHDRREVYDALEKTDAELGSLGGHQPGEFVDDAATETTCRLLARLQERDRWVLTEIEAAEKRLMMGTYGLCEVCARPIASGRLRALPVARYCITCELSAERMAPCRPG